MPSTARMVVKPASHSRNHWPLHLLALQRRRRMDAAAHAGGPSHGCALQRQRSPMAVRNASSSRSFHLRSRQPSLWALATVRVSQPS